MSNYTQGTARGTALAQPNGQEAVSDLAGKCNIEMARNFNEAAVLNDKLAGWLKIVARDERNEIR
jgi:hypothetical protein